MGSCRAQVAVDLEEPRGRSATKKRFLNKSCDVQPQTANCPPRSAECPAPPNLSAKPMAKPQNPHVRVVFTEGGKGGVGKTEIAVNLATWYESKGIKPRLLDFDVENTEKSGFQNFMPRAEKLNIHAPGALDHFFEACECDDRVVLADMGAGAGASTFDWFEKMFDESDALNIRFTAVGVTTNEPGAVISILQWADKLRKRADYLIALNAMRAADESFEYWHDEPSVAKFTQLCKPHVMQVDARVPDFQTELRNEEITLEDIIGGKSVSPFFRKTMQIVRAKRYRSNLYTGFHLARSILLT